MRINLLNNEAKSKSYKPNKTSSSGGGPGQGPSGTSTGGIPKRPRASTPPPTGPSVGGISQGPLVPNTQCDFCNSTNCGGMHLERSDGSWMFVCTDCIARTFSHVLNQQNQQVPTPMSTRPSRVGASVGHAKTPVAKPEPTTAPTEPPDYGAQETVPKRKGAFDDIFG